MRHLTTQEERLALLSFLIFTWMFSVFFVDYYRHYEKVILDASLAQLDSEVDLYVIDIQQSYLCGEFKCFTDEQFVDLYNRIDTQRLVDGQIPPLVDGGSVDTYLQTFALDRGYQHRSFVDTALLQEVDGLLVLPEVREAYKNLRDEMLQEGVSLHLVSEYRSFEDQSDIFFKKLGLTQQQLQEIPNGTYDRELDIVLSRTALPGFSKHHSGYAVDFGCGDRQLVFEFAETECYEWMSQNNFEPAKKHGFIPSYPGGVQNQGPNPEPWEYVWVGSELLQ